MTIPLSINSFDDIVSSEIIKISWESYSIPVKNNLQTYRLYYRLENPVLSSTNTISGKVIGYEYFISDTANKTINIPISSFGTTIASAVTSQQVDMTFLVKGYIQGLADPSISSCVVLGNFNAIKGDSTGGAIQARSTKVQVIDNVLYDEGEVLWYLNPIVGSGPNPTVTKNEYSLWGRVNVDVSSRGNPNESDTNLQGTALIGVGSTDGPNNVTSNAVRVSLSTGKVLNAFGISKFGSNYDNSKSQLTLRGVITDTKDSDKLYLGSNNATIILKKPIVTKVDLPSTFTNITLSDYDGHLQKHAPDAPSVYLYNAISYTKPNTTVPYAIWNLSRTNIIALNLDNDTTTKILMKSTDALPSSDNTVLQRGIYSICGGVDGALFVTQNKITNNSPESPSFICEISKRWDNPTYSYSFLPKTASSNGYRQLGVCTDSKWSSSIGGYYVWSCAESASILSRGIARVKWNGSNFEGSQLLLRGGTDHPFDVRSIVSDGNNNIWASGKFEAILKIYNSVGDENTRYAQNLEDFNQSPYGSNQKYIEYFLTRDHLSMSNALRQQWLALIESNYSVDRQTATDNQGKVPSFNRYRYGIKVRGTTVEDQVANIRAFVEANPTLIGRLIYSKYANSYYFSQNAGNLRFIIFSKKNTTNILGEQKTLEGLTALNDGSGEMGADWSGTSQSWYSRSIDLLGEGTISTNGSTENPEFDPPSLSADIFTAYSESSLNESFFAFVSTGVDSVSAYDNLILGIRARSTLNDFRLSEYRFFTDDFDYDIGSSTMNVIMTSILSSVGSNTYTHTYHDPNKMGHPLEIQDSRSIGESSKTIFVNVSGVYKQWDGAGSPTTLTTPFTSVTILERWPTAKFEIDGYDLSATRQTWWGYGFISSDNYTRPISSEFVEGESYYQSISGTDPLSCDFRDYSIARTWPISGWWYTAGDGVSSAIFMNNDPVTAGSDYQLTGNNFWSVLYTKPGIYYPTLYVRASNTGTYSNILTSFTYENSATYISLSQRVHVLEYEPFAGFHIISGLTHPSSYMDNVTGYDSPSENAFNTSNFISGYSPNLTVYFRSSSEPHSYPIEVWRWNFGDYYNELNNYVDISATDSDINTTYPEWDNNKEGTYTSHTYVMPGYYDVTLCVQASSSGTTSCKTLTSIVYVEEIPPSACFTVSAFGQESPLNISSGSTVAFIASCTNAGSFPICRIDYDFGDNSSIYTVNRILSSSVESTSASDPRNIIVTHVYTNTEADNMTIIPSITAYACNTQTSDSFSLPITSAITLYPQLCSTVDAEERRLIGTRLDSNQLVLTFEGVESGYIYNLALSSISTQYLSSI